jgi:hypothetical protein
MGLRFPVVLSCVAPSPTEDIAGDLSPTVEERACSGEDVGRHWYTAMGTAIMPAMELMKATFLVGVICPKLIRIFVIFGQMHNRSIPIRTLLLCGTGIGLSAVVKIHNRC